MDAMDSFDVMPYMAFAAAHPHIPALAAAAYLALVLLGPAAMAGRPALHLRGPLLAWNALLCAFSLAGSAVMVRHVAHTLAARPLAATLCGPLSYARGAPALWLTLFMASKLPELLDTVFLVLRKRPVSFLHAYHHASVMLYCWHAFALQSHLGLYFTAMNYIVHAVMYFYYALTSAGCAPPWGTAVTLLQISQMLAGCALCAYSWAVGCEARGALAAGAALYASYLVLFVQFFLARPSKGGRGGGSGGGGGAAGEGSSKAGGVKGRAL
jgi:elongation of very long chain fatty acids protein 6